MEMCWVYELSSEAKVRAFSLKEKGVGFRHEFSREFD